MICSFWSSFKLSSVAICLSLDPSLFTTVSRRVNKRRGDTFEMSLNLHRCENNQNATNYESKSSVFEKSLPTILLPSILLRRRIPCTSCTPSLRINTIPAPSVFLTQTGSVPSAVPPPTLDRMSPNPYFDDGMGRGTQRIRRKVMESCDVRERVAR